ncbi:MAG: hypothetical protein D6694_04955, partial [Gammaproteobacteria bacterium]
GLRIGSFLAAVVLLPQIVLLALLQLFLLLADAPAPTAPAWVMLSLFVLFAFLCSFLVREVLVKEGLGGW